MKLFFLLIVLSVASCGGGESYPSAQLTPASTPPAVASQPASQAPAVVVSPRAGPHARENYLSRATEK